MAAPGPDVVLSTPGVSQQTPCDTLPVPQNLALNTITSTADSPVISSSMSVTDSVTPQSASTLAGLADQEMTDLHPTNPVDPASIPGASSKRKLCVRHQRMADEGANVAMQQSLDALPFAERETVNRIWSTFSSSSHASRCLILKGLLTMCCFSQLSLLSQELENIIRIDPFTVLPEEISLRILKYLDAISLGRAAQVSRRWRQLADDDVLWRSICEQHIDKRCIKCGWGLPLMKKAHLRCSPFRPTPEDTHVKRQRGEADASLDRPISKRLKTEAGTSAPSSVSATPSTSRESTPQPTTPSSAEVRTRPWKKVYCERLRLERNWRHGRCRVRTLKGHTDGVMCLQFADNLTDVNYPILMTGSYDHTIRVWNMAEGREIRCIRGHTRAIRALQFDDLKLVTGSMDHTLCIWNWRTGERLTELRGHSNGVVSLHFDKAVLVSGSVDTTICVWNVRNQDRFVLRGHLGWVNSVLLWDDPSKMDGQPSISDSSGIPDYKMLFSASDDCTVRLWSLATRTCVRSFTGHTGQVQSLRVLIVDRPKVNADIPNQAGNPVEDIPSGHPYSSLPSGMPGFAPANLIAPTQPAPDHPGFLSPQFLPPESFDPLVYRNNPNSPPVDAAFSHVRHRTPSAIKPLEPEHSRPVPILISGSLDNTIRVWDVQSGRTISTLFGHIEGVWGVAADKFRAVSGSHDRTVKIWDRENAVCQTTLVGHRGAVTCIALGDDKIVSGSEDRDIKIWDFNVEE
ncbi:WD40 repeat-like protein [Serendipita vermifera]|nr:WD40 repeat-like protein [Serendipita vermifera]